MCIRDRVERHPDTAILVPMHEGQRGNPVVFDAGLRDALLATPGGGRAWIDAHPGAVRRHPVGHPGFTTDLDTLDDVAEDQRTALQDWITALEGWPQAATAAEQRDLDLLKVRSRDVLEHIERVVRHVRRLEQNAETTVQMHFSAQGHRTNEIMRTLTVLTAVFLPLNLITGFFGMNFDFLPLVHRQTGIWWTLGIMSVLAIALIAVFWRKRYLARSTG